MVRALLAALVAAHVLALVWALRRGARDGDAGWWLLGWLLLGPLLPLAARGRYGRVTKRPRNWRAGAVSRR